MREWLLNLGWTNTLIDALEIALYAILVLSGLLAIIKQTLKIIGKIVPRFRELKCLKHKLKFIHTFFNWYCKSIKDGVLSDEEVEDINKKLADIINDDSVEKDLVTDKRHSTATSIDNEVNDVDF